MDILGNIYNILFSNTSFSGGFWGAFFAFIFFLIGEKVKLLYKLILDDRREHVYLERYFNDLNRILTHNKIILSQIVKSYNNDDINISDFILLPVSENPMLKINDYIFVNRLSLFLLNIKTLNANLENINKFKNKINDNLYSSSEKLETDARNSLPKFINQLKEIEKFFDYNIEIIWDLTAENKLLLKDIKLLSFKECTRDDLLKRKERIEEAKILLKKDKTHNPIFSDYFDKAREFGLEIDTK